jgi:hypothetical protein
MNEKLGPTSPKKEGMKSANGSLLETVQKTFVRSASCFSLSALVFLRKKMDDAQTQILGPDKKIVPGQHQNVSGHHQTHLAQVIGQSGKKDADTTFFLYHLLQSRFFFLG